MAQYKVDSLQENSKGIKQCLQEKNSSSPAARVHFGKRVYVGTGAVLINGTEKNPLIIGDDVIIGAGACVTKSIESGTWGGVPAKLLKR